MPNAPLSNARLVVVKLGTGVVTSGIGQLNTARIQHICDQIAELRKNGTQVMVVSSGAVGLGMGRLGLKRKPRKLAALQKCAAVGQSMLIDTWQKCFDPHGTIVGQLLLTREDVASRERHINSKALLEELLSSGVVPIINENDSISAAEIKFGDNDILSAMVASMSRADALVILSTAPGLIDMTGTKEIIPVVERITPAIEALASGTTSVTATGGMITKIQAARLATHSGCATIIASGARENILLELYRGGYVGTLFKPTEETLQSRKRWIAYFRRPEGTITVDAGAEAALRTKGGSLLAKGITGISGNFIAGDMVEIANPEGAPFARGLAQFDRSALESLAGKSSEEISRLNPELHNPVAIHRDELVILG